MPSVDWSKALDLRLAVANVRSEFPGDWHRDPWGWPELGFMEKHAPAVVFDNCAGHGSRRVALLDVPKENWGSRPAMVLDIVDRLMYQAIIDRLSTQLIGDLSPSVFGWRLPPKDPKVGGYSHNDIQWDGYRTHLAVLCAFRSVALRSDLVSFFASIPLDVVRDAVDDRTSKSAVTTRLYSFLEGIDLVPERSGLPQRSIASAVLANMVLRPIDDLLDHYADTVKVSFLPAAGSKRRTFARWMDDIWLFLEDPSTARRAQVDLQNAAQGIGLHLNSAKTDVVEGDDVAEQAMEIEHSAVDGALDQDDAKPLEELIDKVLDDPEHANRTTIKFMSKRIRDHNVRYRQHDLVAAAPRMPHASDSLALVFKEQFTPASLQDWLISHVDTDWAAFEWSTAQFVRMFPSNIKPKNTVLEFCAEALSNVDTSLPLLAVAAQRVSSWNEGEARTIVRDVMRRTSNPQARRVLALAALNAGETRTSVRKWLSSEPENGVTLAMLDKYGFAGPKVVADYAT